MSWSLWNDAAVTTAEELIRKLKLQPLPLEGGFFLETYRARDLIPRETLGRKYDGPRNLGTAIYYLLTPETFSAMHSLPGDEIFHFYLGDPVEMLQLKPDGSGEIVLIGNDLGRGMTPQVLVEGSVWQGSRLLPGGRFALLGTTMAPGFEFADYKPGDRSFLLNKYPAYADQIAQLTKGR